MVGAEPEGPPIPPAESAVPDELAAEGAVPDALVGPSAVPQLPAPAYGSEIERAWFAPASTLEARVTATRRASLQYGVWNLDPAARALLYGHSPGSPLDRARGAVRLAPDLPAARMELARAIWLHGDAPLQALRIAWSAVGAIGRHLEASVWFAGTGLWVLAAALVGGGLLCISVAGVLAAPHAAHDLGDLISRDTPQFGRAALLAALLLTPLALGEGPLGLALVLMGLGVAYGSRGQRVVLALAAGLVMLGAYPVARFAGTLVRAWSEDPVLEAAFATAHGSALENDVLRLDARSASDPLAVRGVARRARRTRSLSAADALYQKLLVSQPDDWVIANNAANVRLDLGHIETALALYQRAAEQSQSPVVYFNLAQAYGRAFQVDDLANTLRRAQSIDGDLVAELTQLQGTDPEGFVVDLPLQGRVAWTRIRGPADGEPIAAELRRFVAPSRLGRDARVLAGAALGAWLTTALLGSRLRRSRRCARCGRRLCPRCDREAGRASACGACTRLFQASEGVDRARRVQRIEALRERERRIERGASALCLLVPGLAGLLARRPGRSLLGSLLFALAAASVAWRHGAMPDPMLAGSTAPFLFLHVGAAALLGYALLIATSLAARRRL